MGVDHKGYLGAYAIGKYTPKKMSVMVPEKSCCKIHYPVKGNDAFCRKCGKPLIVKTRESYHLEHIDFFDLMEEHDDLEELSEISEYLELSKILNNTHIFISNTSDSGIFFDGKQDVAFEEIFNIDDKILNFKDRFSPQFDILKKYYDSIEFKYGLIYYFS